MGLFEKDHLIRLLEKLTETMAAIAARIAGGEASEAIADIDRARAMLAGPLAGSLARLDAGTIVSLLGADKARGYAGLARLEADARSALGDGVGAERARRGAEEIEGAV